MKIVLFFVAFLNFFLVSAQDSTQKSLPPIYTEIYGEWRLIKKFNHETGKKEYVNKKFSDQMIFEKRNNATFDALYNGSNLYVHPNQVITNPEGFFKFIPDYKFVKFISLENNLLTIEIISDLNSKKYTLTFQKQVV